ncbi:hypothetical protein LCGC14_0918240 [marine sediment metagenome]|uniref:Uncharacterized protein n=1 Tax=marine sediment metagenome TaxID=412755 RepID=A0A0F9PC95_9ZZZZ|nr:hypothetical protein [bacterium]
MSEEKITLSNFRKFIESYFPDEAKLSPQAEEIFNKLSKGLKTPRTIISLPRYYGRLHAFYHKIYDK